MKKYSLLSIIKFLVLLILFTSSANLSFSKIEDPRIWDNLYTSCVSQAKKENQMNSSEIITYCKCTENEVTNDFKVKELILFEADLINLSQEERIKLALLNDKITNIWATCASKIFK